jgi:rod shape-determining protein MreD
MTRTLLLILLITAGTVIDGAWLSRLPLRATPDLALLVALSVAIRHGLEAGVLAGALTGYLRDLVSGSPLGLFLASYLVVGAAFGAAMPLVNPHYRYLPAATAVVGTALLYSASGLLVAATALAPVSWIAVALDASVAAGINALLARPVHALVGWIDDISGRRQAVRVIPHKAPR